MSRTPRPLTHAPRMPLPVPTQPDVAVIGGGPAGMAAAIAAAEAGARDVVLLERNEALGGILPQCVHNGFGALNFGADLPGPAYALRYERRLRSLPITVMLETMVTDVRAEHRELLDGGKPALLRLWAMNSTEGYLEFQPRAVVLAMGCRERTRAQILLPGTRAAGVYTAGTVQRLVNIEGYVPGERVIVLGSGDIGMIMARRLRIEGAEVPAVVEVLPHLTGLRRNYVQCLRDFDIPLHLSTTVTRIIGIDRVKAVELSAVDRRLQPIAGSARIVDCDTLLLSVGLIPENELSLRAGVTLDPHTGGPIVDAAMATTVPGIFAAGNVTAIYDLVDYVSRAGELAGRAAAEYAAQATTAGEGIASQWRLRPGENVGSVVPQRIGADTLGSGAGCLIVRPSVVMERRTELAIRAGRQTLIRRTVPYARPAEMIVHSWREKDIEVLRASARAARYDVSPDLEVTLT